MTCDGKINKGTLPHPASFKFQIVFIRKGDLPKEKTWFLYFVGGCVIMEAIFTDILLFQ